MLAFAEKERTLHHFGLLCGSEGLYEMYWEEENPKEAKPFLMLLIFSWSLDYTEDNSHIKKKQCMVNTNLRMQDNSGTFTTQHLFSYAFKGLHSH